MATLVWDQTGERFYQTGVDRGVLYLHDGRVAVWNGLTNVEESSDVEIKSSYLDGVKYLEVLIPGDFQGKLSAFTYPDEFDSVMGIVDVGQGTSPSTNPIPGLYYYDQPPKSFDLSYRTIIGDDVEGTEYGYKIHILYNIFASSESISFNTFSDSGVEPVEFSWSLSGIPPAKVKGFRPTIHLSIDSTKTPPDLLKMLEDILYGTDIHEPSLPSIQDIAEFFGYLGALLIIDHGGGMWSAVDESNTYITMLDATTFQIDNADATFLDPDTYQISSTNIGEPG
jgi:hypothetical protein